MAIKAKGQRNYYVSYSKGWAIISIMAIHLLDWSNQRLSAGELYFKELLYPSVLFFIATAGSVVYLAYAKKDLGAASKKLFRRGAELIGIYFLYNIVKLFIFNFSVEPFYAGFMAAGKLTIGNVLSLKSFTAPLSIILTIGVFLLISPLLLYLAKNRLAKIVIGLLVAVLFYINYYLPQPAGAVSDFLYARNNVMFPLLLWLMPFLMGFYLAMLGLQKHKGKLFLSLAVLTAAAGLAQFKSLAEVNLTGQMYPLKMFYIFFSFAFMYLLIYLFAILEQARNRLVDYILAAFRLLGDHTLAIYIYHWIVIDLTLWLFYPRADYIWYSAPAFLLAYLILKRKKIVV
ncbi:MAG: hypothetical protein Q7R92_04255 [bacterium]|nr:hypothetical protein [bacterium]